MKWKPKPLEVENGEIRVVKRFALFPTILDDGHKIWLERYLERQQFYTSKYNEGWWLPKERYQQ